MLSLPNLIKTTTVVFAFGACSSSKVQTPPRTDAPPAADVAPAPDRVPGLDAESRESLKREYRALALKNDCSRGYKHLDGTWRFAGETKTPNYSEQVTFNGTRWTSTLAGDPDGKHVEARIDGEVRCLFKNRVLMRTDKVAPDGAFGNRSGDDYPCDLLGDLANSGKRMMMICYFDWDVRTAGGLEFEYVRVEE